MSIEVDQDPNYQPKHAKRRPLEDFCEMVSLPIGIITGAIAGLILVAVVLNI